MANKKLFIYLISTFIITWGCWWLLAYLTQNGILAYGEPIFMIFYLLGGLAPTYTPFITIGLTGKKADFKEFRKRLFKGKVNFMWYLVVLLLPYIIQLLTFVVTRIFDQEALYATDLQPWYLIFSTYVTMIIGGGLEELGWRGIMLPELQKEYNATVSSLILGIIWVLWHLPLFFLIGVSQYQSNMLVFALLTISFSFILSWIYNNTQSILLCVLYHAMVNTTAAMGVIIGSEKILFGKVGLSGFIQICILGVMVVSMIIVCGYKTFIKNQEQIS